jgi:P-type Ca2+ transporter type 2C
MQWYAKSAEEILKETGSSQQGLSDAAVQQKLAEHGPNELQEAAQKSALSIFLSQFVDVMILVLIAAAIISGLIGDLKDTLVIAVIIVLNAVVGFVQEYRAEKAMQSLKKIAAPTATVLRNNATQNIPAAELVPGDVVLVEAGNIIPADLRLIESASLKIDESSLTGESVAIDKIIKALKEEELPLGDRLNMAYKGTIVTNGRGRGVIIATGMKTELGKIAGMLQEKGSATPLQQRMSDFSKKLSIFIILLCGLLFLAGYLRGEDWVRMLLTVLSLAVAAIPEALPAVITIALAIGAKRLVRNNALTRKLHAVETLGSVTYICTDKTGTLTQNKMTVQETWTMPQAVQVNNENHSLLLLAALNHDVKENKENNLTGDPTEIAVYRYATEKIKGIEQQAFDLPRVEEIPFDADRKCMTTIHQSGEKFLVVTKGAVESLLVASVEDENDELIRNESNKLAAEGMRVLAYGMKWLDQLPAEITPQTIEKELHFTGLIGMIDPPREEAAAAIKECKSAGIIPVMITGDHPVTAEVIAKELGIISNENDKVITGAKLAQMSEELFGGQVEKIKVYARVSPEQKLQIIKALQKKEHFVAMTGDGVNDAPSLKKANIGVAMGITGTDVSKEAAHMILLDDNFATIVKAVREGRRIYDNIRKFIKYIMTGNSAEIWAILLAPIIGLPVPLLPIHILWINLVTDGLPALALAVEPEEKSIMQRPPRKTDESIFSGGMGFHIIWVGLLMGGLTTGIQAFEIYVEKSTHWQTIVFTVLCLGQMWHVLAIRSETRSLFKQGLASNRMLTGSVLLTFVLQLAIIYVPTLNIFFNTQPLTTIELLTAIGVSSIVFIAVEIEKMIKRRKSR